MSQLETTISTPPAESGPAWDIARMFPNQGHWTETDYFQVSDRNWLVELAQGRVEVLPMPNVLHQLILAYLYEALRAHLTPARRGTVLFAPLSIRLGPGHIREPDLALMLREHADRILASHWEGADLVLEVVSDSNRSHDLVVKRGEYATAGIPEYWIVDPQNETITVLALEGEVLTYTEHGVYGRGERAASRLLEGFGVDVSAVLDVRP
jgi:Uma2 family endonuclease